MDKDTLIWEPYYFDFRSGFKNLTKAQAEARGKTIAPIRGAGFRNVTGSQQEQYMASLKRKVTDAKSNRDTLLGKEKDFFNAYDAYYKYVKYGGDGKCFYDKGTINLDFGRYKLTNVPHKQGTPLKGSGEACGWKKDSLHLALTQYSLAIIPKTLPTYYTALKARIKVANGDVKKAEDALKKAETIDSDGNGDGKDGITPINYAMIGGSVLIGGIIIVLIIRSLNK